ncbi:MAG: chromate transporter [Ruminococcaceae bacterium]|nr:chromate transporter [Oscillospiraceae bacterium]
MNILADLFLTYFRVGAVTFGGGYAMIPILEREVVKKKNWVSEEELLDYYAISQCTPGVIAVNAATFVGYKMAGVLGSVFATLGVISPSIIIITIIANMLSVFSDNRYVTSAFKGISIAVCALVFTTVVGMIKKNVKNIFSVILAVFAFVAIGILNLSPIIVVIAVLAASLIRFRIIDGKMKKSSKEATEDSEK